MSRPFTSACAWKTIGSLPRIPISDIGQIMQCTTPWTHFLVPSSPSSTRDANSVSHSGSMRTYVSTLVHAFQLLYARTIRSSLRRFAQGPEWGAGWGRTGHGMRKGGCWCWFWCPLWTSNAIRCSYVMNIAGSGQCVMVRESSEQLVWRTYLVLRRSSSASRAHRGSPGASWWPRTAHPAAGRAPRGACTSRLERLAQQLVPPARVSRRERRQPVHVDRLLATERDRECPVPARPVRCRRRRRGQHWPGDLLARQERQRRRARPERGDHPAVFVEYRPVGWDARRSRFWRRCRCRCSAGERSGRTRSVKPQQQQQQQQQEGNPYPYECRMANPPYPTPALHGRCAGTTRPGPRLDRAHCDRCDRTFSSRHGHIAMWRKHWVLAVTVVMKAVSIKHQLDCNLSPTVCPSLTSMPHLIKKMNHGD